MNCPDCFDTKNKFIKLIDGIIPGRWMCSLCNQVWDGFYMAQIKFYKQIGNLLVLDHEKNAKWTKINP